MSLIDKINAEYLKIEEDFRKQSSFYISFMNHDLPVNSLVSYLEDITYLVAYSEVALQNASERAKGMGDAKLSEYFYEKYQEEKGHVVWGQNDVRGLAARNNLSLRNGASEKCLRYRNLVDELIAGDPINYVSYLYFMEKITVRLGPDLLRSIKAALGVGSDQITLISKHVELDQHHDDENEKMIAKLLSEEKLPGFILALDEVAIRFTKMLDSHVFKTKAAS